MLNYRASRDERALLQKYLEKLSNELEDRDMAFSDNYPSFISLLTLLGKHLFSIRNKGEWELSETLRDTRDTHLQHPNLFAC